MWRRSHTSGGVRTSDGTVSGWRVGVGFIATNDDRLSQLTDRVRFGGAGEVTD